MLVRLDPIHVNLIDFKFQIVFSSPYEIVCPFIRDYDSICAKLQTIEEWDKMCILGVNNVIMAEWDNATACQVILITDDNPGVGPMSLGNSLSSSQNVTKYKFLSIIFSIPGKIEYSLHQIAAE